MAAAKVPGKLQAALAAVCPKAELRTALPAHVSHVLGMRAEEKVIRVDAARLVALVADHHAVRYRAVRNLVGYPMRRPRPPL